MKDKVGHVIIIFFFYKQRTRASQAREISRPSVRTPHAHSQLPHAKGPLRRAMGTDATASQQQARASPPQVSIRIACRDLKNKKQAYQGPIPTY